MGHGSFARVRKSRKRERKYEIIIITRTTVKKANAKTVVKPAEPTSRYCFTVLRDNLVLHNGRRNHSEWTSNRNQVLAGHG